MKKNGTARALLLSALSLLLCVSMLVGSTFAWFTDSVVSGNNTIIAGNLDVELEYAATPNGTYDSVAGKGDLFVAPNGGVKGLWEPGHTEVAYLKVTNKGSLALQYKLSVSPFTEIIGKNADGGDIKLSEILKFAATEPSETAPAAFTRQTAQEAAMNSSVQLNEFQQVNITLEPAKSHYIALVVYMPESVGNEANYRGDVVPTIEFAVTLLATQEMDEDDSFGDDYDGTATYPNGFGWVDKTENAPAVNNTTDGTFSYENKAGTFRASGKTENDQQVLVNVIPTATDANFEAKFNAGTTILSYDISVTGQKPGSEVALELFVGENLDPAPVLYHKGVQIDSTYNANTGMISATVTDFSPFAVVYAAEDAWDGTADTSWYNDTDTTFVLKTAEEVAGFAALVNSGNTFAGKTVKLGTNINLYCEDTSANADGDPVTFRPIGDYSMDGCFEGTFDGQNKTISNLYQNGWDLGYEWGAYGSYGLFGSINNATIKNLTLTGAESYIEGGDVGGITGSATGKCVFENITIEDSVFATYNNGCGGIIAWSGAGEYTFKNITIAEDTVLAGLWGSFDSSIGGIVGQGEPGATYNFEKVTVACRIDAYNDCTASYDYYNYRMCGMLIGRLQKTTTIDGANYPDTSKYNIICNDVTVKYGEWMNYHYCEPTPGLNGGRGMRVEAGYSYDGLPADYDHSQCVDQHMNLIPFDQIFGGDQLGVKGLKTYTGVNVVYPNP